MATKTLFPLPLAKATPFDAQSCITGGWGVPREDFNNSNKLQVAKIAVKTDCNQAYDLQLPEASFCGVGVSGENVCKVRASNLAKHLDN